MIFHPTEQLDRLAKQQVPNAEPLLEGGGQSISLGGTALYYVHIIYNDQKLM